MLLLLLVYQLAATTRFRSTISASVIHSSNFQLYNSGPTVVVVPAAAAAVAVLVFVAVLADASERKSSKLSIDSSARDSCKVEHNRTQARRQPAITHYFYSFIISSK